MAEGTSGDGATPIAGLDPRTGEFTPARAPSSASRITTVLPVTHSAGLPQFHTISGTSFSNRRFARPPMPLFSSDPWCTDHAQPIKSATVPPKQSWESSLVPHGPSLPAATSIGLLPSPRHLHSATLPRNAPFPSAEPGEMNSGHKYSRGKDGRITGVQVSPISTDVDFARTQHYHKPGPGLLQSPGFIAHSDPLPQREFVSTPHKAQKSPSGSCISRNSFSMSDAPNHPSMLTIVTHSGAEDHSSDGQDSVSSGSLVLSDHYSKNDPGKTGLRSEVWSEKPHSRGLRRALKDTDTDWVEAYPGAVKILCAVNPEAYQMPWGTRVINIKTEFPNNVIQSIRHGTYSVMEKVSERIMKIWEARQTQFEKVLFLFSVNGSKRFAGLAEMSGAWDPKGVIEGWQEKPDAQPSVGAFPVQWVYIKDVAYHQFDHIRQPHNGNPVGNMWNGMNFPGEVGREVVKAYVESPATTCILGYPSSNGPDDAFYDLRGGSSVSRRVSFGARGSRGGRGSFRGGALRMPNWRHTTNPHEDISEDDRTPTAAPRKLFTDGSKISPQFNAVNSQATEFKPGMVLNIIVNAQGRLELVKSPSDAQSTIGSSEDSQSFSGLLDQGLFGDSPTNASTRNNYNNIEARRGSTGGASHEHGPFHKGSLAAPPNFTFNAQNEASASSQLQDSNSTGHDQGSASFGCMTTPGNETPTHRPSHHSARTVTKADSKQSPYADVGAALFASMSDNMLKAKFYSITSEQYFIQHEMEAEGLADTHTRLLKASLSRALANKREVQAQLALRGLDGFDGESPIRHDSFSSIVSGSEPESLIHQFSPVHAVDGPELRPVTKVQSPISETDTRSFDRAPGGSGRSGRSDRGGYARGHVVNESWDSQTTKSITDLLKSPEKSPLPTRLAHETSSFFSPAVNNPATRAAPSFFAQNDYASITDGLTGPGFSRHSDLRSGGSPLLYNNMGYNSFGPQGPANLRRSGSGGGVRLD